jgi:outer membrane protein OmpA-like peptidoglycan-associated protein
MLKNVLSLLAFIAIHTTISAQSVVFRLNNYSLKEGTNITTRLIQGAEIGFTKHLSKVFDLYLPLRLSPRGNVETYENSVKTQTTMFGNLGIDAALQAKYDNGHNFLVPFISAGFGTEIYDQGMELGAPVSIGLNFRIKSKVFITLATNYRLGVTKTTPVGWMNSIGIVTNIGGKEKAEKPVLSKQEKYLVKQEEARLKAIEIEKQAKLAAETKLAAENRAKEEAEYKAQLAAKAAALDKASMPIAPLVISEEIKKVLDIALQGVQFETGRALLIDASFPKLDDVATTMLANPELRISIEGHTDNTGNESTNLKLSEARARTCMTYLMSKGIGEERLKVESFGSTRPVTDNDTEIGRGKNRRVEFLPF